MNARNNWDSTAFDIANEAGHTEIVNMLTAAIEVRGHKQEAMELAMEKARDRNERIPRLSRLAKGELPTIANPIFNYIPPNPLGGKRKTRKNKRKTRGGK